MTLITCAMSTVRPAMFCNAAPNAGSSTLFIYAGTSVGSAGHAVGATNDVQSGGLNNIVGIWTRASLTNTAGGLSNTRKVGGSVDISNHTYPAPRMNDAASYGAGTTNPTIEPQ